MIKMIKNLSNRDAISTLDSEISRANEYNLPQNLRSLLKQAEEMQHDDGSIRTAIKIARYVRKRFQQTEAYQRTRKAWIDQDNKLLEELIPQIFEGSKLTDCFINLYHGIDPKPEGVDHEHFTFSRAHDSRWTTFHEPISIADYLDRVANILKDGLKCSRDLRGGEVDENIRAIYTVPDFEEAYGILVLELPRDKIEEYPIFKMECGDGEHLIYTPLLDKNPNLLLVSRQHYLKGIQEVHYYSNPQKVKEELESELEYRDKVQEELERRKMDFEIR